MVCLHAQMARNLIYIFFIMKLDRARNEKYNTVVIILFITIQRYFRKTYLRSRVIYSVLCIYFTDHSIVHVEKIYMNLN